MKLKSFLIKNYRSIVDSGLNHLSADNITGLIGQNESGKTSVLESLLSFYNGRITDDIIRSDLSMPEVTCVFEIKQGDLLNFIKAEKIPVELQSKAKSLNQISLTRKWYADKTGNMQFSDPDFVSFYTNIEERRAETENSVLKAIEEINANQSETLTLLNQCSKDHEIHKKHLTEAKNQFALAKKAFRKARKPDDKINTQKILDESQKRLEEIVRLTEINWKNFTELKAKSHKLDNIYKVSVRFSIVQKKFHFIEEKHQALRNEIRTLDNLTQVNANDPVDRTKLRKLDQLKREMYKLELELNSIKNEKDLALRIAEKVMKGIDEQTSIKESIREIEYFNQVYSLNELGKELAKHLPGFRFFEDFSSLLPNKIDLEDIIKENDSVEGYKAVSNFLTIAGLDAGFFLEKNTRILKQKIENLNTEITIDFQDYWRQSVGKNNKISINFELAHYDNTHPERSGRPYLEFWIRDRNERLYPKQRSRGVRWFLSFYLELKASAKQNGRYGVLLIDEPGVSLHARAQEDVLKVFEDIKETIQIVYTTHSPHLIDLNKLYRLLAVQRIDENDDYSPTIIIDAKSLQEASPDTLSPIYTLMGTRLDEQQYIQKKNNVLLEDLSTYYYLSAFYKLFSETGNKDVYLLPATEVSNINTLVNLLMGWKLDFVVLLDDDEEGNAVYDNLKKNIYHNNDELVKSKIIKTAGFRSIEDIFSTLDFKKHIIQKRIGITEKNSEYIDINNLNKITLAAGFMTSITENKLTKDDFDDETKTNIKTLLDMINSRM
jgi:predicted ATP-dependent endonuclease of OLD family